ncbi:MAG: isocitrate lyase/phosphoenolpyruvate mutase family protein [Gammaproteobacteria bacterium]
MSLHTLSLPEHRRPRLAAALREHRLLRAIECHNPLSAMIGASAACPAGSPALAFDALWASGFSHATAMGLPDAELSLCERRIDTISDIAAVCALPIIADADTGGDDLAFVQLCRRLEGLGVSAVIVEDKSGAKRTSLADNVAHQLEDPRVFSDKIAVARRSVLTREFLVFARIESLIAGAGLQDALARAEIYLRSAADGIVIHSKDKTGEEIFAFMAGFATLKKKSGIDKPLVLIPTAYNHVTGAELHQRGAQLVIHGNHMVRAAFRAMQDAARSLLEHDRSLEADSVCAPVKELFDAVGVDLAATESKQPATARGA